MGDGGAVRGTTDGGDTWALEYSDSWFWLSDVTAVGPSTALAVGQGGRVLVKTPSEAWHAAAPYRSDWLHGVAWSGPTLAVAVGDNGAVTVTVAPTNSTPGVACISARVLASIFAR